MKKLKAYISLLLLSALILSVAGCAVNANASNLMSGVSSHRVSGKAADAAFISSAADFSIELFKKTAADKENSLISPLSVILALSMTANGADSETLAQMEKLLGGEIPLAELNEYLYNYVKGLPSSEKAKLSIANSIWFRDDEERLQVEKEFLQNNADYYGASLYKSAFDAETLNEINSWVKSNTDGMIDNILNEINEDAVLYLINTVAFDAKWDSVYDKNDINRGAFTDVNGNKKTVEFMHSEEYKYLDDGRAAGFIKPYAGGNYSFAALLPNEGISIEEYIASLTGEGFIDTVGNAEDTNVIAFMPKFSYEYEVTMNDALKALGIPDAFDGDKADFSKMAVSTNGNIFISEVRHKTFISVDELGTKAGAATIVEMSDGAAPVAKTVRLDRPFVFAIIDTATNLPVFIGTVMTV